jgi:hypothetical protein
MPFRLRTEARLYVPEGGGTQEARSGAWDETLLPDALLPSERDGRALTRLEADDRNGRCGISARTPFQAARGGTGMSGLSDFVRRGVRLIVTERDNEPEAIPSSDSPSDSRPREIAADDLSIPEPAPILESHVPSNVTDFSEVYTEAGVVAPAHGYGVQKVAEMLANPRLIDLGREVKASAVLTALEAAGVSLADVIQDAVRRDQALDAFEVAKQQELERLDAGNRSRLAEIDTEIQDFLREKNAEVESLKASTAAAKEAFAQLAERKRREEQWLQDVVRHFVEPAENPITATGTMPPAEQEETKEPEQS